MTSETFKHGHPRLDRAVVVENNGMAVIFNKVYVSINRAMRFRVSLPHKNQKFGTREEQKAACQRKRKINKRCQNSGSRYVSHKYISTYLYVFENHQPTNTLQSTNQIERVDASILANLSSDGQKFLFEKNQTKSSFRKSLERQLEATTQSSLLLRCRKGGV